MGGGQQQIWLLKQHQDHVSLHFFPRQSRSRIKHLLVVVVVVVVVGVLVQPQVNNERKGRSRDKRAAGTGIRECAQE